MNIRKFIKRIERKIFWDKMRRKIFGCSFIDRIISRRFDFQVKEEINETAKKLLS